MQADSALTLPPVSTLTVQALDFSLADAPARVVAEQSWSAPALPVHFDPTPGEAVRPGITLLRLRAFVQAENAVWARSREQPVVPVPPTDANVTLVLTRVTP